MKYRIIKETKASGKALYYVQYGWGIFWFNVSELDISFMTLRKSFDSEESARVEIKFRLDYKKEKQLNKIIKKEIIPYVENEKT